MVFLADLDSPLEESERRGVTQADVTRLRESVIGG